MVFFCLSKQLLSGFLRLKGINLYVAKITHIIVMVNDQILIGPLQDPVKWCRINYTGTQITQWDFQNKGESGWTGKICFVLEVPLHYLRPSIIYSVS